MNEQQHKAQRLADFYRQVAEGGVVQVKVGGDGWVDCTCGPDLSDIDDYRIAPKLQTVDMSVLERSGLECEFSDSLREGDLKNPEMGELESINPYSEFPFRKRGSTIFEYCRPRMNHWYAWLGGNCPLPEGVMVEVATVGRVPDPACEPNVREAVRFNWRLRGIGAGRITAFRVVGLKDGYQWPVSERERSS